MAKLLVQKRFGTLWDQLTITIDNHNFAITCYSWDTDNLIDKIKSFTDLELKSFFEQDTEEQKFEW